MVLINSFWPNVGWNNKIVANKRKGGKQADKLR
jgi:hypothetical protein